MISRFEESSLCPTREALAEVRQIQRNDDVAGTKLVVGILSKWVAAFWLSPSALQRAGYTQVCSPFISSFTLPHCDPFEWKWFLSRQLYNASQKGSFLVPFIPVCPSCYYSSRVNRSWMKLWFRLTQFNLSLWWFIPFPVVLVFPSFP